MLEQQIIPKEIKNVSGCAIGMSYNVKRISKQTHFWKRKIFSGIIQFSPLDLRIYLRLLLFMVAWKFLSCDYTAIVDLNRDSVLNASTPSWVIFWSDCYRPYLFGDVWSIRLCQIGIGLIAGISIFTLNRWGSLAVVLGVIHFEWVASLYRSPLSDLEYGLSLLIVALLWPSSWKSILSGGSIPTNRANLFGYSLAAYIAISYFLTGISKINTNASWLNICHIECLYYNVALNAGYTLPSWLEPVALNLQWFYHQFPLTCFLSKLIVLCAELLWPLALCSKTARRTIPLTMFVSHLMIFLSCGALFLPMAVIGVSIVIPWRKIQWVQASRAMLLADTASADLACTVNSRANLLQGLAALFCACAISLAGSIWHTQCMVSPFIDYMNFGFIIPRFQAGETNVVYRLGLKDRTSDEPRVLPVQCGGFFDYLLVSQSQIALSSYVLAKDERTRSQSLEKVWAFTRGIRTCDSYRWCLGVLSHPPHVIASPSNTTLTDSHWRILKGSIRYLPTQAPEIDWVDIGALPLVAKQDRQ